MAILPAILQEESKNLFKRLSFSCSFYRGAGCLCFRSDAFSWGRVLIYFGNEGVTMRWGGWKSTAVRFYWYILQSHFAFSLFAAVVTDFLPIYAWNPTSSCSFSFFPPSLPLFLAPFFLSLLTFCERTIPPVHSSIEQITFWVAPSSRNSSHPRSFFPLFFALISQFLRESGWISIIINLYNSRGNLSKFSSCSY